MSAAEAQLLLRKVESTLEEAAKALTDARAVAEPAGFCLDSTIIILSDTHNNNNNTTTATATQPASLATTEAGAGAGGGKHTINNNNGGGIENHTTTIIIAEQAAAVAASAVRMGHCNTDHMIFQTGDIMTDRIEELKRTLQSRLRAEQPESRERERKWDKPKKLGERRRRIVRETDMPEAPPVPPPAAYVLFVCQMTAKIRHDNGYTERHCQANALREISTMWRMALSDEERDYYHDFYEELKDEYQKQLLEYRATGYYTRSDRFEKAEGTANLWLKKNWEEKNALERELAGYETFVFLPRPPDEEEAYQQRLIESRERRKLKLRAQTQKLKEQQASQPGGGGELATSTSTTGEGKTCSQNSASPKNEDDNDDNSDENNNNDYDEPVNDSDDSSFQEDNEQDDHDDNS